MVLELEPELAVLRPIRTAASSSGVATARPDNDGSQDAGCVTPTSVSSMPPRQQGGAIDVDAGCVTPTAASSTPPQLQGGAIDVDAVCVTPTSVSSVPPPQQGRGGVDVDAGCVTPTSAASVLRPATVCPPAPRKPARAAASPASKRKCCGDRQQLRRSFFPVPRDLGAVFVPRGAAPGSPASSPVAKKIRVDVVG